MSGYYRFDENNDHEGETWSFFIPAWGNEGAIAAFRGILQHQRELFEREGMEFPYSLSEETIPEEEVDVLVFHGDHGYMARYNKLEGKLSLEGIDEPDTLEDFENLFYKGKIADFVKGGADLDKTIYGLFPMDMESKQAAFVGDRVRTVRNPPPEGEEPAEAQFTDEGLVGREWDVEAEVVDYHNSHGLHFDVRHKDGRIAYYLPWELELID